MRIAIAVLAAWFVLPALAPAGFAPYRAKKTETAFESGGERIKVWRFTPAEGKGPWPGIVLLHGLDGMDEMERVQLLYMIVAGKVADKGYVVDFIHYFDRSKIKAEDAKPLKLALQKQLLDLELKQPDPKLEKLYRSWVETVKDGVEFLRQNPKVEKDHIGALGLSLGGFLATSLVVDYPGQRLCCLANVFGGLPPTHQAKVRVNKLKLPPILIMAGEDDDIVPEKFQRDLLDLWRETGNRGEAHFYGGVGHAFFDKELNAVDQNLALNEALPTAIRFLNRHLPSPGMEKR